MVVYKIPILKVSPNRGIRFITTSPPNDKIGITEFGKFINAYDSSGTNETGITKYNGRVNTIDNDTDTFKRYNPDFTLLDSRVPDQNWSDYAVTGLALLRHSRGNFFIVPVRAGNDFSVALVNPDNMVWSGGTGIEDHNAYTAIATDGIHIYLFNSGTTPVRIEKRAIFLSAPTGGIHGVTFGPVTTWNTSGAIRGLTALGDYLYSVDTLRNVRQFNRFDGSGGDIVLKLDSRVGQPQGLYAEFIDRPVTLGISTTATVRIIKAHTKRSATQSLGIKDDATAARTRILTSCLLYTSPSPRDRQKSRMPSSA